MSSFGHSRPARSAGALFAKLVLVTALALTCLLLWVTLAAAAPLPVTFAGVQLFTTDEYPDSVAVGDFNGDGKADLVTANGPNDVSVLLNNGNGGLPRTSTSPRALSPPRSRSATSTTTPRPTWWQ